MAKNKLVIQVTIVVLFSAVQCFAQNYQINGIVTDINGEPIPYVSIYVDATSFGTTSDLRGKFTLNVPLRLKKVELIASLVGYQSKQTPIEFKTQKSEEFNIKLNGITLDEAVVTAKMDRFWKKKWKIFRKGLLGDVSPARNFIFENREAIKLEYDEEDKNVFATSSEPLIIINEKLGYKVKVDLQYFKSDGIYTKFSAYKFFDENLSEDAAERKRQLLNREKTYFQTLRHFLVSLKNNTIAENKYDVYKINKMNQLFLGRTSLMIEIEEGRLVPADQKDIYSYDSENGKHYLHSDLSLLVFNKNYASYQGNPFSDYFYEFSRIDLPNYFLEFNGNGYITRPNGLILSYHWSKEGIGQQLPAEYFPNDYEHENNMPENQISSLPEISPILAKQIKNDSLVIGGPQKLDQSIAFSRFEEEDKEPEYLYEPDISYKLALQDANQSIFQILKRVPSLRVIINNNTGEYDIFLQGSNTSLMSAGGDITPNLVINNRVYRTKQEVMDQLLAIDTRQVKEVGLIKYGGGAIFGATGGNGTIVILMENFKNAH